MQVICPRKDLYDAVQTVGRAVSGRSTMPILSHILATPQGDGLRLTATDLEMWMECHLPARIQLGIGDDEDVAGFTAPSRVFTEILGALPEADVTLDRPSGGSQMQVRCARSDYKILGLPADEFPGVPEVAPTATFTIAGDVLRGVIRHVLFAVATDETRPILTGVLLSMRGDVLKAVATDTHRLAVRTVTLSGATGEANAIVPARALNELLRLSDDEGTVSVSLAPGQARFEIRKGKPDAVTPSATITMVTRLIEGQFPNYERVLPTRYERRLILETSEFAKAVKRVAIVARENANRIVLSTEGAQLILSAEAGSLGSVRDEVEVAREGGDIQISFNSRHLNDLLNVLETEGVALELTEPLRPGVVRLIGDKAPDYLCVLMPMQLM